MTAEDDLKRYNEAKSIRSAYEEDWKMAAAHVLPRHFAQWQTDGPATNMVGTRASKRLSYDATGALSLPKYAAVLQRMLSPDNIIYQKLVADNDDLMRVYNVRDWFDRLTRRVFKYRRDPSARWTQMSAEVYNSIGTYGHGVKSIVWGRAGALRASPGMSYKTWPVRDVYVLVDDEGNVIAIFRRMFMNARQFRLKWGNSVAVPAKIQTELIKPGGPSETKYFEIVHYVYVRDDYDPLALNARRHPWAGRYISVEDAEYIGAEEGFASNPYVTPRISTEPGDVYGYSPAMTALGAMGGASATKKSIIKGGQKMLEPPLLINDDGVLNGRVDVRPNGLIYGGLTKQGQPLVQPLQVGEFSPAETVLQDDRSDIRDSFFVTLFQVLLDNPNMTATQVVEMMADRGSLLAPTMGRGQSEYLAPVTQRELILMIENGVMEPMPPELIEAKGEYKITYGSPLAKMQYADEVAGFQRAFEFALRAAEATQDPSHLDHFDLDTAIPEIADILGTRTRWMRDAGSLESIREQRSEERDTQSIIEQAPAIAGVVSTAMKQGDKRLG